MKKADHPSLDVAILQALFQEPRRPVSGVDLAAKLGVTRTAIWKHIEQLQGLGYPIEAQPQLGYRFIDPIPDLLCADEIVARGGRPTRSSMTWNPLVFRATSSTQDLVTREAGQGAPEGLVVIAEHQTGGRGRRGRSWTSTSGLGLYLSLLLRPAWPLHDVSRLTIMTSLAAAEATEGLTGLQVQIKWPNDLLIDGRKLGGILTEVQSDPDRLRFAAIGLGLNFHHRAADFPAALRSQATSLHLETQIRWRRADWILRFLPKLEHYYAADFPGTRQAWMDRCLSLGKTLTIETPRGRRIGQAMGLDEQGALLLRNDAGQIEVITAGDII